MNNYYSDIEKLVSVKTESDKREYAPLINAGVAAMLEKLRENKNKKGFGNVPIEYSHRRLTDEMEELTEEIYNITNHGGCINFFSKLDLDHRNIRREAADIMNFAAMIVYKCDQEMMKQNEK